MRYPEITALYKYRKCDQRSLSSLCDRKVWFCKRTGLNDPFDSTIMIKNDLTDEEYVAGLRKYAHRHRLPETGIQEIIEEQLPRKTENVREHLSFIQKYTDSLGIYCLTELPDNILMWAHYADAHRGFCIEYDRTPDNPLGRYDVTRKMQYNDHPKLFPYDFWEPDKNWIDGMPPDDDPYMQLTDTKAPDSSYEKEWRIKNDAPDTLENWPAEVKSIIFGMKMLDEDKAKITEILGNSVAYKQAKRCDYEFKLGIIEAG